MCLSCIAVMFAAACAGANAAQPAPLDATFAQIQVHEAGIEHSRATLARDDVGCEERCAASASAAQDQERLCALARTSADADALERCARAQQTCAAPEQGAHARCGCHD
jgi:hypothetical protein